MTVAVMAVVLVASWGGVAYRWGVARHRLDQHYRRTGQCGLHRR